MCGLSLFNKKNFHRVLKLCTKIEKLVTIEFWLILNNIKILIKVITHLLDFISLI